MIRTRYNLNADQVVQGYKTALNALARYDEEKQRGTEEVAARELAIFHAGFGMNLDALDRMLVAREQANPVRAQAELTEAIENER